MALAQPAGRASLAVWAVKHKVEDGKGINNEPFSVHQFPAGAPVINSNAVFAFKVGGFNDLPFGSFGPAAFIYQGGPVGVACRD